MIITKIMKYQNLTTSISAAVIVLVLTACGGGAKSEKNADSSEFDKAKAELQDNVEKVLFEIPSPAEIPFILQASGADYSEALINDIDNIDGYAAMNDKAVINLGIYSTDIGYLSAYDKAQDALNYMRSCRKLADNLGLSDSFSSDLLDEFESNVESKDSLATLVNRTIADAEGILQEDNRGDMAALLITGGFVEGLYLATQIVDKYPNDEGLDASLRNMLLTDLIKTIMDQEEPLADLIEMLKGVDQNETTASILKGLEAISASYSEIDMQASIESQTLSEETIKGVTESVAALRGDLVS